MILPLGKYAAVASSSLSFSGDKSTWSVLDNLFALPSVLCVDVNLSVDLCGYKLLSFSSLHPKGRICYNISYTELRVQGTLLLRKIDLQMFLVSSVYAILADFP